MTEFDFSQPYQEPSKPPPKAPDSFDFSQPYQAPPKSAEPSNISIGDAITALSQDQSELGKWIRTQIDLNAPVVGKVNEGQLIKFGEGFTRFGQGIKQHTLEGLEYFNFIPKGTAKAYTELTDREKTFIDQQFNKEFGDKGIYTIAELAGESAPYAAMPGGGSTRIGRLLLGAVSGAVAGGATYTPKDQSTWMNVATGAIGGAILSPLLETVPAVKEFFKRHIGLPQEPKSIRDIGQYQYRQAFIDRGLIVSDKTGVDFKLSQLTGDPATEAMERLARQGIGGERLAREKELSQVRQVLQYWNRTVRNISSNRSGFGEHVGRAFDQTMGSSSSGRGLLGARKLDAARNFRAVNETMGSRGTIPLENLSATLDDLIAQNTQRGASPSQLSFANELKRLQSDFIYKTKIHERSIIVPGRLGEQLAQEDAARAAAQSAERSWKANVSELQNLLSTYGDASQGSGRLFTDAVDKAKDRYAAKRLFGALMEDMGAAADSNIVGASELQRARQSYAAYTTKINEVRDSALGKLFGKSTAPTGADIEQAFRRMKPSEISTSIKILEQTNPDISRQAQRFYLKDYLTRAQVPGMADAIGFVPAKMLDVLKDRERFKAMFPDTAVRQQVMDGLHATRRIMMNNFRTGARTLPRAKELAGVIASRDRTFVARLAVDLLAPEVISRALLEPDAVQGLMTLAKPYNQNAWSAALSAISNGIRDNMETEQNGEQP